MVSFQSVYPTCYQFLGKNLQVPEDQLFSLGAFLDAHPECMSSHIFLSDLARVEAARYLLSESKIPLPPFLKDREVNPNLQLIEVQWQGLPELLHGREEVLSLGQGFVLVWKRSNEQPVCCSEASPHDLLALKLVSEGIGSREAAEQVKVSVGFIDDILYQAENKGLLVSAASRITRPLEFNRGVVDESKYFTTPTFTLQWHITQKCDLHCRHCYDRSERSEPDLDQCLRILDELYDFCQDHNVFTQITFTGGNPLLYPSFNKLYKEAVDRGFLTAILGNPMSANRIEEILAIQKPEFYQVSLEGLPEHNDFIRGRGHFNKVINFLALLQDLELYSMVMLTLTRANMDQVVDLAELLRGKVDLFTFNRLAMVGEGAALASVPIEEYRSFLLSYIEASKRNSSMGLKDNLINLLHLDVNKPLFGGCAGRGCGAAFNFIALLPDGEVHACRKFPSPIGNINTHSLTDIYHGELAQKYRAGSSECAKCSIRPVCGGCLAVGYGFGLDIFKEKDPYCWML
ncbi:MAG: thio(seleno)oxazole modification radical SAM maturase SbtM [Desulfobulbaceae bacterium]|nr:thio(seleno)oxazole modification radical SAM maturase SbtM [Desulfobulbaceae bacterium]